MLAKVFSATIIGLEGVLIEVEVDVSNRGFPTFTIVGLPNKAVDEAKDRVRTAIVNAGFDMPDSRITVNLAPADIPKMGSSFDLPIAVGILAANGIVSQKSFANSLFVGELSLEGRVRKVPGIVSVSLLSKQHKISELFLPEDNISEAALVQDVSIYPVKSLSQIILHLLDRQKIDKLSLSTTAVNNPISSEYDFADIKGQNQAKRALEIAAAGFHNIHLKGTPGAGKTLLSRAFSTITPRLEDNELLEVSKIYSATGQQKVQLYERPFRAPHHTISRMGLIGGGSFPLPGEISLAHRGVLFLDEFSEFPQVVLEALRQPLEDGKVTIARASGSITFPCRFQLLAASNPCPCGYFGHLQKKCTCIAQSVARYKKKLSGPLLDRIDLHVDVRPVEQTKLVSKELSESSNQIKIRVLSAKERQAYRFKDMPITFNSEMSTADIKQKCALTEEAEVLLTSAIKRLFLSGRGYTRTIKVAQTIADLVSSDRIEGSHIAEALQYRIKG